MIELLALCDDGAMLGVPRRPARRGAARRAAGRVRPADRHRPPAGRRHALRRQPPPTRCIGSIPAAGRRRSVSSLTVPFDGDARSGVDFNPAGRPAASRQPRRAEPAGQRDARGHRRRWRAALSGRRLGCGQASPRSPPRPTRTTSPMRPTRSCSRSTTTATCSCSRTRRTTGSFTTVGPLGVDFGPLGGFDIVTEAAARTQGFAASGATLYAIDLTTGAAR